MERRDFIKDQIDQLGKVLGKILANFMGLKTEGDILGAIEVTNQSLKSELDLDIDNLVQLESSELEKLIESTHLTDYHLDQLSNYLYEIGISDKKSDAMNQYSRNYLMTAKGLMKLANERSRTITFDRIDLERKIEEELK